MKTMLIPILTVAATCTAFADLTRKDSSEFDYKYEMVVRPDQQDLDNSGANDFTGWSTAFTLGTGADVGSIKIDASSNGKYLLSNQDVGTAGDGWHSMEPSSSTGFTVEARVKVTACTGNNGAICIEAGPSDSKVYARLNLFGDKIGWNGTTLTNMDTSAYHTYRIAREGGKAVHSVWVDGVLVAENLGTGFTYNDKTLYRMLLGSPGSGWTGKAEVAWLRFHKGAYAPVDEKAYVKANRLHSDEFDVKYEMNDGDNRISTSASASDWSLNGANGATIAKADGVLSVNPNGNNTYWTTTDATWKNTVTAGTPYTIEFSAKINSCALTGDNDRSLLFWAGSTNAVGVLMVGVNHVYWQTTTSMGDNILLDTSDNTDKMHRFRIAYDGSSRHGFTVWRDDVMIGHILIDTTAYYKTDGSFNFVRFGKPGGNNSGSYDIDYVRWKIGGVYPPDTRKGMMVIVK
ncbi:MAG: hypothetical protein IJS36_00895 [Kiritimatiellae bacterium]|nr:hypothetical protein [Kiritimatiellia bacterium]